MGDDVDTLGYTSIRLPADVMLNQANLVRDRGRENL